MPRRVPQLAKLSRPRLHKAVPRERLFTLLDDARIHKPAICVVGPPGAGKTTLVASWLDARGIKGIWYQVDPGDADLATFFYYIAEAVKPFSRRGQRPLPLLTPEYLHDIEGFSRRFFRHLFARLPNGAAVVMDNYQEMSAEHQFHLLIAQAITEVPEGANLIVVSRRDPPTCYSRLIGNQSAAFIDWPSLKLTFEESEAIAAGTRRTDVATVRALHQRSDGWAAGLVLLLERHAEDRDINEPSLLGSMKDVFDYFAGQIFDTADPASQQHLLRMSFLPTMTLGDVAALTGSARSGLVLEDFFRRHLFVDRRGSQSPVYQFHALFHAFLQHRAQQSLDLSETRNLARTAARILEERGAPEDAIRLYLSNEDFEAARLAILREAEKMIAQGRWRTVAELVNALPEQLVRADRWLNYWLGIALASTDPVRARPVLVTSHALSSHDDDLPCQILCAAGVIQTYMLEYTDFRPMDPWIEKLGASLRSIGGLPNSHWELRATSSLLIALSFRKPDDPALPACADRVFELIQGDIEENSRTLGAAYLVAYGARTGPVAFAQKSAPLLKRLLAGQGLTGLTRGWGWWVMSFFYLISGNEQASRDAVKESARIGEEEALPSVTRFAAVVGTHLEMDAGNLAAARQWAERLEKVISPGLPYDRALNNTIKAFLAVMEGDSASASDLASEAVQLFDQAGVHHLRCVTRSQLAWALMLQGKVAEARKFAVEALALALAGRSEWVELDARATLSAIAMEQSDAETFGTQLRRVLELFQITNYIPEFSKNRAVAARICSRALSEGIHASLVARVIRRFELQPPPNQSENWPWPIRIYVLGRFHVVVDEAALKFSRKAPKKPIALLKALIAHGGADVSIDRLVDAVWPEGEGGNAHDACWLALHRLRKLLGSPDAVYLTDGRMTLNRAIVWTDIDAFERLLKAASIHELDLSEAGRMLSLYAGDFLPDEPNAVWAVATRERLRGHFVHQVEAHGRHLADLRRFDEAIAWYLRGIDSDPMAEAFYQGLMRCYSAQGRLAEAMSTYRRLKQILSISLGISPSSSTEAIARTLRSAT